MSMSVRPTALVGGAVVRGWSEGCETVAIGGEGADGEVAPRSSHRSTVVGGSVLPGLNRLMTANPSVGLPPFSTRDPVLGPWFRASGGFC